MGSSAETDACSLERVGSATLEVVRLGDTEETDGGPLRLDTYEELCALETLLTRESDA